VEKLKPNEFIANHAVNGTQEDVINGDAKTGDGLIGGGASGDGGTSEGGYEHGQNTSGENETRNSESDENENEEDGYVYDNDASLTDGSEVHNAIGDSCIQIPTLKERSLIPVTTTIGSEHCMEANPTVTKNTCR
jgi:hypothetical protein